MFAKQSHVDPSTKVIDPRRNEWNPQAYACGGHGVHFFAAAGPLLGREEVPADAGNIRPKFHGQDFGNINDTNSIRRFWLLFLPTPNTPAHVDDF
jgi:hypothetical protein